MTMKGCKCNGQRCKNCGKIHRDTCGDNNISRRDDVNKKRSEKLKGKKFTEDHCRNISLAKKVKSYEELYGIEKSLEIRKKQSEKNKGDKNPFFGKKHKIHPMKGKYHKNDSKILMSETRKRLIKEGKINIIFKGKTWEEIYGIEKSDKMKKKQSSYIKGKHISKDTEFKKGQISLRKGIICTEETKKRSRISHLKLWKNEEYRKNQIKIILKACCECPNKFESKCHVILNELFPDRFKYVGDGSILINFKSPDFIDEENKTVVLANGIYWHLIRRRAKCNRPDLEKWEVELKEKEPFERAGYNVLFIWEDELDNIEELFEKIKMEMIKYA